MGENFVYMMFNLKKNICIKHHCKTNTFSVLLRIKYDVMSLEPL